MGDAVACPASAAAAQSGIALRARGVASAIAVASLLLALPACSTFQMGTPTADSTERMHVGTVRALLASEAPQLPASARNQIAGVLLQAEREHGLDSLLVMGVIAHESDWRPNAVGPKGSRGLVQMQPQTGRALAQRLGIAWQGNATLDDPVTNVRLGVAYLAELHEQFGRNRQYTLAAYNIGPGRVDEILRSGKKPLTTYSGSVLRERDRIEASARSLSGNIAGL
jgi:soluble lytic murein transglycosylase-like protein